MYKHVGRLRAARQLGADLLAEFHMNAGEMERADVFLRDAVRSSRASGWTLVTADLLCRLADCQRKQLNAVSEDGGLAWASYLKTCLKLVACSELSEEKRLLYWTEVDHALTTPPIPSSSPTRPRPLRVNLNLLLEVETLVLQSTASADGRQQVLLVVNSLAPVPLRCKRVVLTGCLESTWTAEETPDHVTEEEDQLDLETASLCSDTSDDLDPLPWEIHSRSGVTIDTFETPNRESAIRVRCGPSQQEVAHLLERRRRRSVVCNQLRPHSSSRGSAGKGALGTGAGAKLKPQPGDGSLVSAENFSLLPGRNEVLLSAQIDGLLYPCQLEVELTRQETHKFELVLVRKAAETLMDSSWTAPEVQQKLVPSVHLRRETPLLWGFQETLEVVFTPGALNCGELRPALQTDDGAVQATAETDEEEHKLLHYSVCFPNHSQTLDMTELPICLSMAGWMEDTMKVTLQNPFRLSEHVFYVPSAAEDHVRHLFRVTVGCDAVVSPDQTFQLLEPALDVISMEECECASVLMNRNSDALHVSRSREYSLLWELNLCAQCVLKEVLHCTFIMKAVRCGDEQRSCVTRTFVFYPKMAARSRKSSQLVPPSTPLAAQG